MPVLLLAGCVVPPVDDGAPLPASDAGTAALPVTVYDCQGRTVEVRFGEFAAELTVDGRTDSLPRVVAASGAKYELGQDEAYRLFWAKGSTARIALSDAEWLACDVAVTDGTAASAGTRGRAEGFQALGVEPSWSLAMLDGSIVFNRGDGSDDVMATLRDTVERPNGGARHVADVDGRELVVDVSPGACTDGMSNIAYPASVEVSFEGAMLQGCGGRPESTVARPG